MDSFLEKPPQPGKEKPQINQQPPSQDLPPFDPPEAATNYEVIRARELGEVVRDPEHIGLNFDSAHIVSPNVRRRALAAKNYLASGGTLKDLAARYSTPDHPITSEKVQLAIQAELSKPARLARELSELPTGAKFRIHPDGPQSPFNVTKCIHADTNSHAVANFDPDAMQQIAILKEKAAGSDLTVVMSLWRADYDSDLPNTPAEIADYTLLCQEFVRQSGFAKTAGEGLVLELGNETNVNRTTRDGDARPFDRESFANSSSPDDYAKFYTEVASALKSEFPRLKLAVAGTAFYDPTYLSRVVSQVAAQNPHLIDVLSFHPYRDTSTHGTAEIKDNQKIPCSLNFEEQLERLRTIAKTVDATVNVGEVSFTQEWGRSIDTFEQARNTALAQKLDVVNYLWPGEQILRYP